MSGMDFMQGPLPWRSSCGRRPAPIAVSRSRRVDLCDALSLAVCDNLSDRSSMQCHKKERDERSAFGSVVISLFIKEDRNEYAARDVVSIY